MNRHLPWLAAAAILTAACTSAGDDPAPADTRDEGTASDAADTSTPAVDRVTTDVLVYGSSSGGIGAAVGAARQDLDVILVDQHGRIGGMATNGVTSDLFDPDASTGLYDEFRAEVAAIYAAQDSDDGRIRDGLFAEPDVALTAIETLVDAEDRIDLWEEWWLDDQQDNPVIIDGDRIEGIIVTDGQQTTRIDAPVIIDASVVGDVLGFAGEEDVDWQVGREAADEYDEQYAPEQADSLIQAFNYRMTFQVGGRTDYELPDTWEEDRQRFDHMPRERNERWNCTYEVDGEEKEYNNIRIQRCLPDGKMDINIDLVGFNHDYPTANRERRLEIEDRLHDFGINWLHYVRTEMGHEELGLSNDDYLDNDGMPTVLYVREARRLLGEFVFTEHDAIRIGERYENRTPLQPTSVTIGDYGLDSHRVGPVGTVSGDLRDSFGGFWQSSNPYQVPFEVMVPHRLDNLLVPVAVSASKVGYSTLRMEPVRMNLGFAAGMAAPQLLDGDADDVRDIDIRALQEQLLDQRQALVFYLGLDQDADGFADEQLAILDGDIDLPADYQPPNP